MKYDASANYLKLPKNIRQVGRPGDKIKIYVEDYVITYVNQLAKMAGDKERLAVLLGQKCEDNDQEVLFVHGAIEAKEVLLDDDEAQFTPEIWSKLYEDIQTYFHDAQIVGWMVTRPGKILGPTERIKKIHTQHFPGEDKVLYMVDPVDKEEAFFIYRDTELTRQEGYYIYYERNEDMQNYLVEHQEKEVDPTPLSSEFLKKREEIMEKRQENKEKILRLSKAGMSAGLKKASSLVVTFGILFALIFGFSQLKNKEPDITDIMADGALTTSADAQKETAEAPKTTNTSYEENASAKANEQETMDVMTQENIEVAEETESTEETTAVPVQNIIRQYEVLEGDTLAAISQRFYNSYDYIDIIQEMNEIEDADMIFPGMQLVLP